MTKYFLLLFALLIAGCNQLNTCPCIVTSYEAKQDLKQRVYYNYKITNIDNEEVILSRYSSRTFYSIGDTIK